MDCPNAWPVCEMSPNVTVPAKKRGAWAITGTTTDACVIARLNPLNLTVRKTIAQAFAITAANRLSSVAASTRSPRWKAMFSELSYGRETIAVSAPTANATETTDIDSMSSWMRWSGLSTGDVVNRPRW